jgi:hypothetical protein
MLHASTECYVRRAHPQSVNVVAIPRIAAVQNDGQEPDVGTASSGADATDSDEVLEGPRLR